MKNRDLFARILTVAGTVLVWIPILAALVSGIVRSIAGGKVTMDWLMPAELFLFALAGAMLLLWASDWADIFRKQMLAGFAAMPIFLIVSQAIAATSGIASGARPAEGFPFAAAVAFLVLYTLALIYLCVMGILFLRRLYRKKG